jgi:lysophospholipid acyltransferase (LPLAT)-like uncharacterized protein
MDEGVRMSVAEAMRSLGDLLRAQSLHLNPNLAGELAGTAGLADDLDVSAERSWLSQLLITLQQLQAQSPIQFQQVVGQIAGQLQSAAQQQGHAGAGSFLLDLAAKFQNIASGGPLSQLQPPDYPSHPRRETQEMPEAPARIAGQDIQRRTGPGKSPRRRAKADDLSEKADRFADLSAYSFKQRLVIRAADLGIYSLIHLIGRTVRFEVEGWEHVEAAARAGQLPIYAFWHDAIFLSTYYWRQRGIAVMNSQSFDGEYCARFSQRFGYRSVRGSSTRGGVGALIEMMRMMRQGCPVAFTSDGPKGPRHVASMGSVFLAKKTGQPILPMTITAAKFWELSRTWDRFQIPRPFTRACVQIAAPIFVLPDTDKTALEVRRVQVQAALDDLERRGQDWRTGCIGSVSL